jgi:WG containing repeat
MTSRHQCCHVALYAACTAALWVGHSDACDWTYPIWIPRSLDADPLYRFVQNGKVGYVDQEGKVVLPAVLEKLGSNGGGEFHSGLLEVGASDGVYINATGKKVIDKGLYRGWDFSEGLAVAMTKVADKWGYINTSGEFAISPRFETASKGYVWSFEGGFAKIDVLGKIGYIDHSGEFVISPRFLDGDSFHDGMARVVVEGPCFYSRLDEESPCADFGVLPKSAGPASSLPPCKYTFADRSGRIISNQRYEYARNFGEGLAPIQIGKVWGYIDKEGAVIVAPRFDIAAPFSDGLARVSEKSLFGFISHSGEYAITPRFKYAGDFADGRAVVGDRDSYWYIDHAGRQAIPGKFALASPFFKGLAHVKMMSPTVADESIFEGTFAYITSDGKRVFTYKID